MVPSFFAGVEVDDDERKRIPLIARLFLKTTLGCLVVHALIFSEISIEGEEMRELGCICVSRAPLRAALEAESTKGRAVIATKLE